jgi:hypothetical protein
MQSLDRFRGRPRNNRIRRSRPRRGHTIIIIIIITIDTTTKEKKISLF